MVVANPQVRDDVARVRLEKTRVLAEISRLATEHEIRLLAAGGPVFAAQGLISPRISRSAAVVVDPAAVLDLLPLLYARGWMLSSPARRRAVLPSVVLAFEHPELAVKLDVYTSFPGFYTDQGRAFAILWARRKVMTLHDTSILILDRLSTVIMAVHDRLGPQSWNPRAEGHEQYLLDQFQRVLRPQERGELLQLTRALAATEPMRPLLEELGMDAGSVALPTEDYARWRLELPAASRATHIMLGIAECPRSRRMRQSWRVMRESPGAAMSALLGAPRALCLILTSRRRMERRREQLSALV